MKELICIVCPRGCHLRVDETNDYAVTGNSCPRGAAYGRAELTHPTRVLTSTVRIDGAIHRRCPVKTDRAVPKEKLFEIMDALNVVTLTAPVTSGQLVLENVAGTDARVITTRAMARTGSSCAITTAAPGASRD